MKVVAVYNMKGGVGKTTAAVNLSYLAAAAGRRVLVWDLDPQAAASFAFRVRARVDGFGGKHFPSAETFLEAIKETGTDDPLKVAAKMREKPVEDFFSRNGKLREDNLMVHDLWLVQVKKPEESKYPYDYYKLVSTIPADQAFRPLADGGCSLVK